MITIHPYNAVHVKLDGDIEDLIILQEPLCFYSPGFQYSPAFKDKRWDGKIHLLNTRNFTLPLGLVEYFAGLTDEHNIKLINLLDHKIITRNAKSNADLKSFIESLQLPKNRVPRQDQIEGLEEFVYNPRALISLPTASGKSLVIYLAVRYCLDVLKLPKVLIVVPSKYLSEQLYNDLLSYSSVEWSKGNTHRIYDVMEKDFSKAVTISTYHTLCEQDKKLFHTFDAVFVDEVHKAKSTSIKYVLNNSINAYHRFGLTGTLENKSIHKREIEGLFSKPVIIRTIDQQVEAGVIAKPIGYGICVKYTYPPKKKLAYHDEVDWLINCEERNQFIANIVSGLKGNTIILCTKLEHISKLKELLPDAFLIHGEISVPDREAIFEEIGRSENSKTLATFGCMSTGVNVPRLNNILYGIGYGSDISTGQSIGRLLRRSDGKTTANIYDVYDDLTTERRKSQNHTLRHFHERNEFYMRSNFEMKYYTVTIDNQPTNGSIIS